MEFTPTEIALWSTAWLAFGWWLNHRLEVGRDRSKRLREFRNTISVLLDKFKSSPNVDLIIIHHQSVSNLKEECARMLEDIRFWRRDRFQQTCSGYCGMSQQDIRNYDPSHIANSLFKGTAGLEPPKTKNIENFDLGRAQLLKSLTELRKLAR
jgi:hypothetical protein